MWSSLLVKKSFRKFSTFSKVQSNAILLSSMNPTRIKIPVSEGTSLDYAIHPMNTVGEFIQKVTAENKIKLSINSNQEITMDELTKRRFEMTVNDKLYTVHPHVNKLIDLKNKEVVDSILEAKEMPLIRRSVLSMFLDHLVPSLPKDAVSKAELKKIIADSVKNYNPKNQENLLKNIKEELEKTEKELYDLSMKKTEMEKVAQSYASKVLAFGVTMAMAQVGVFAHLIYGVYSWDDIEPVTYLTGAFYA